MSAATTPAAAGVTLDDVRAARARIGARLPATPVCELTALSRHCGATVTGKLETVQPTGSFKVRGAWNHLLAAGSSAPVVTYSTGNHGRAVTYVARALGRRATVVVGEDTDPGKFAALRGDGADVVVAGATQDDAAAVAGELAADRGLDLVAPFDDPGVIAGQGTIGLELAEQLESLDTVLVPASGGGLLAGVALALAQLRPGIRVIAVGAARSAQLCASLCAGHPVPAPDGPTLADSLRGGIGGDNRHTFALARAHVDEVCVVEEDAIGEAMAYGLRHAGLVLEGAAAVGIAALLSGAVQVRGERVAVVLTGRSVELERVLTIESAHRDALTRRLHGGAR